MTVKRTRNKARDAVKGREKRSKNETMSNLLCNRETEWFPTYLPNTCTDCAVAGMVEYHSKRFTYNEFANCCLCYGTLTSRLVGASYSREIESSSLVGLKGANPRSN